MKSGVERMWRVAGWGICLLWLVSVRVWASTDSGVFVRRIMAGDRLRINVAEQPDLSKVYTVAGDGTVDFSYMGRIELAELTLEEAVRKLESLLEENYFKDATVSMAVSDFVEGDVIVMGAVMSPQNIGFRGDSIMTLVEAISRCGGLAQNAAGNQVKILRWKPGGGMERQVLTVDVSAILQSMDFTKDQYLRPRDIVMVPTLGSENGQGEFLALGAVGLSGFHPYSEDLDIIKAVTRVGGISDNAIWDAVRIMRPRPDGNYTIIPLNLARLFGAADMSLNIKILPGDILFVPSAQSSSRGQVYLLGEVTRRGPISLPLSGDATLARTILAAGGFGQYANESKVKVLRTAPDGVKQTMYVDVGRILKTGAFEEDIPLQDGDVVIVPEKILGF